MVNTVDPLINSKIFDYKNNRNKMPNHEIE